MTSGEACKNEWKSGKAKDRLKAAHEREGGGGKGSWSTNSETRVISGRADSSAEKQKKAGQDSVLRSGNKAQLDLETY